MNSTDFSKRFTVDMRVADELGFNPYYRTIGSDVGNATVGGERFIDLASNNYLGLASDGRIKQAMTDAVREYGSSMCGTPIATGYAAILHELENRLSAFAGLQSSVVFPSCYQANVGLFAAIIRSEDVVVVDHYAHASLVQGIRAAGCRMKPFLHNDLEHLRGLLRKSGGQGKTFVVTESVFSTEGSIAPLDRIVELCAENGAFPIVDDSHGIGVLGKSGRGILEEKNISDFRGIYTASLGKALANAGGVVSGPRHIIDFLRYSCSSLIYSTALPPATVAGTLKAVDIVESEFGVLGGRMRAYKNRIAGCLTQNGFTTASGAAPISSVLCGSPTATVALSKALFENRILSTPFIPPSVPPNQGRVRLIAGAGLKEDEIRAAIDAITAVTRTGLTGPPAGAAGLR